MSCTGQITQLTCLVMACPRVLSAIPPGRGTGHRARLRCRHGDEGRDLRRGRRAHPDTPGANSPARFQRSVTEQAAAVPGARQMTLHGYDHNAPPEVLTPILTEFFTAGR